MGYKPVVPCSVLSADSREADPISRRTFREVETLRRKLLSEVVPSGLRFERFEEGCSFLRLLFLGKLEDERKLQSGRLQQPCRKQREKFLR